MNTKDETPHYMEPNEDCMGYCVSGYWRQFLECSDGRIVIGSGMRPADATNDAMEKRKKVEELLALPLREQLRELTSPDKSSLDIDGCVRLMARILLEQK